MSAASRPRLAVVASHPIQHFCPLYREIANDPRIDLKVFFASRAGLDPYFDPKFDVEVSWGDSLIDGFESEFLDGADSYRIERYVGHRGVDKALAGFRPDVIQVYGYRRAISRRAISWARRRGVRVVMISDSELLNPRGVLRQVAKQLYVRMTFRRVSMFLTVGEENERYYRKYGVPEARMLRSPFPIDSPQMDGYIKDGPAVRASVRQRWGLSADDLLFLTVGKSVARKSHDHVLRAAAQLSESTRKRSVFMFAGGGPDTQRLVALADNLDVRIVTAGLLSVPDLLRTYLAADVLVHPSMADPHPLAISEAVYAGLPIVVSDRVGSWGPTDDVWSRNGLRYDYGDTRALSAILDSLVSDPVIRTEMAAASTQIGATRRLCDSARTYVAGILQSFADGEEVAAIGP